MSPDDYWPTLEADSRTYGGIIARRVYASAPCDIRLAVESAGLVRMLLIMIDAKRLPPSIALPSSRGFESLRVSIPAEHADRVGVAVRLVDQAYRDVFSILVSDVAEVLSKQKDDGSALRALINRLTVWQGFMQRVGSQGLDVPTQIGLFGELRFLQDQLIPCLGCEGALNAWTGPDGTPQDFQCGPSAVEVKTTAIDHLMLRVSNALQLDDSTIRNLFLVHYSVDRREGHGQTLVDVVGQIKQSIVGSASATEAFATRLLQVGYVDSHADLYRRCGFTVRELQAYRVGELFPRILPSLVPAGVFDITYSIQAAAMSPYSHPLTEVIGSLEGAAQ